MPMGPASGKANSIPAQTERPPIHAGPTVVHGSQHGQEPRLQAVIIGAVLCVFMCIAFTYNVNVLKGRGCRP